MGSIGLLFDKILTIHNKHGPFELTLCIGDFFGPSPGGNDSDDVGRLLGGQLRAPIPCYIMQGEYPLPERVIEQFSKANGELCSNVFLLSKSAVVTTAEGLRIACIGGTYKAAVYNGSEIPHVRIYPEVNPVRQNHCRAFRPLISRHKRSQNYSPTPFPLVWTARLSPP
jgi:hypothetical protein